MSQQSKSPEILGKEKIEKKDGLSIDSPENAAVTTKAAGKALLISAEKGMGYDKLAQHPKEMPDEELKNLVIDKINNSLHVPIVDGVKKLKNIQGKADSGKLQNAFKELQKHPKIISGKVTVGEQEELLPGEIFEKIYDSIWKDDCGLKLKPGLRLTEEKINELITMLKDEKITLKTLQNNLDDAKKFVQRIEKILK